jgi:signal transduction histidine kinase
MKYSAGNIASYKESIRAIEIWVSMIARGVIIVFGIPFTYMTMMIIGEEDGAKIKILLYAMGIFFIINIIFAYMLFFSRKGKESFFFVKSTLLAMFAVDLWFISALLYIVKYLQLGEYENYLFIVYWLLIIRSAIYFPEILTQVITTLFAILFYAGAYFLAGYQNSELVLRITIIVLVNISAMGLLTINQRKQEQEEERQERTIRMERLNLAGLVAKEAAHSLKNPLAIISNACYLLDKYADDSSHTAAEHLNIIKRQVERADGIITELTKYSELATGTIGNADVNVEIKRCIHDLEYEIRERNIAFAEELSDSLPKLMIDEGQLHQVLSNIILNACQAIEGNKGIIQIRTATDADGNIRIEIHDNGKGIAEKDIDNIFKAYFTTKEGGSGIGLSLVHTIMQAYNGTISVESAVGQGTTFTLLFPTRTHRIT